MRKGGSKGERERDEEMTVGRKGGRMEGQKDRRKGFLDSLKSVHH